MRTRSRDAALAALILAASLVHAQDVPRPIRWGMVNDFPPMTFINDAGEPDGFLYRLYSRILREAGLSYELVIAPFPEIYQGLLAGTVDLFVPLQRNEDRENLFHWPEQPAINGWGQLFVREGQTILTVESLRGSRIGLICAEAQGGAFLDLMNELGIEVEAVYFPGFTELLPAVRSGEVDGGVAFSTLIIGTPGIQPTAVVFSPAAAYATTSLENERMIPVADEVSSRLRELVEDPESWYWDLREEWLQTQPQPVRTVPSWLFALLLVALLVMSALAALVLVLWIELVRRTASLAELNHSLEERVRERTEKLNQAIETIRRNERVALTSRLVAGIAHQINTPIGIALTALTFGRSQLDLVRLPDERGEGSVLQGVSESMQLVEANIRRAAELVTRFRSVSSNQASGREELVNLREFVANTVATMESGFRDAGHHVQFTAPDQNMWTWPMSISEILMNLMVNSLDHAFPGYSGGRVEISAVADASTVTLVHRDNGTGMSADVAEHARDLFFTTDRSGRHAGLGLNIVQNLVEESLHGEVTLSTGPGAGTQVTVRFPVRMES